MSVKLPLEVYRGFWEREPGIDVCVKECRAYCCRLGVEATIQPDEVIRLNSKLHGSVIDVYWHEGKKRWRWRIGKPCLFLQKDNMCSIHDERPECCRRFPAKPTEWCAVWPLRK